MILTYHLTSYTRNLSDGVLVFVFVFFFGRGVFFLVGLRDFF